MFVKGGLARSQRYQPNQQLEIYNFRVVPGPQISKEVDLFMIHMFFDFVLRKQGGMVNPELIILAEFYLNVSTMRFRCNEMRYRRGF